MIHITHWLESNRKHQLAFHSWKFALDYISVILNVDEFKRLTVKSSKYNNVIVEID